MSDSFLLDGKLVCDKNIIASSFNSFFVNVGANLPRKIPSSNIDPTSYISDENMSSMFLLPTGVYEVNKIVGSLKHASPGCYSISPRVDKEACDSYCTTYSHFEFKFI